MKDWFENLLENQQRAREERAASRKKSQEERPDNVRRFLRALIGVHH